MGTLVFQATLGGAVNIIGPNIANTINFTLPSADGSSGQTWTTNGSGLLTFGTLGVAGGGTGLTTLATGSLSYGAGTSAFSTLAIGTAGQILTVNSGATAPQWSTLTGVAVTTFSAGTTGFTPSSATAGAITLSGTLVAANGGTGQSSYAVGDLLYASTTTALSKLADVATGNALISGGVGVAPSWGKIGLTTHVSGTLPTANGGTNLTSFTSGGVVYASSTSALATGSGLIFDGSNLGLNCTPSPWGTNFRALQINDLTSVAYSNNNGNSLYANNVYWNSSNNSTYRNTSAAAYYQQAYATGAHSWHIAASGTAGTTATFTQAMTLDADGDLGIGTSSPAVKLDISGTAQGLVKLTTTNSEANINFNISSSTGNFFGITGGANFFWNTGSTERMRLDSAGNLGLGVTPSAWSYTALQVGSSQGISISSFGSGGGMSCNAFDSATGWKYVATAAATLYQQNGGAHKWNVAASGTAGNAITFTQVLGVEKDKSLALQGATSQTGTGITFPATQSASSDANTLDDYEEGTWTPTDGSGASLSFTGVVGTYTKVGRLVTALAELTYPTTASGLNAIIGGLPFTAGATGGINGYIRYTTVATSLVTFVTGGPSTASVSLLRPGVNTTNVSMSAGTLLFAVIYYV